MTDKKLGRPPTAHPIPAAERIRQFRNRQERGGLVRTEISIPRETRESMRGLSGQLGMPYAQAVSSLLEVGMAVYQANATALSGSSDALLSLPALLSQQGGIAQASLLPQEYFTSNTETAAPAPADEPAQEPTHQPTLEKKD